MAEQNAERNSFEMTNSERATFPLIELGNGTEKTVYLQEVHTFGKVEKIALGVYHDQKSDQWLQAVFWQQKILNTFFPKIFPEIYEAQNNQQTNSSIIKAEFVDLLPEDQQDLGRILTHPDLIKCISYLEQMGFYKEELGELRFNAKLKRNGEITIVDVVAPIVDENTIDLFGRPKKPRPSFDKQGVLNLAKKLNVQEGHSLDIQSLSTYLDNYFENTNKLLPSK